MLNYTAVYQIPHLTNLFLVILETLITSGNNHKLLDSLNILSETNPNVSCRGRYPIKKNSNKKLSFYEFFLKNANFPLFVLHSSSLSHVCQKRGKKKIQLQDGKFQFSPHIDVGVEHITLYYLFFLTYIFIYVLSFCLHIPTFWCPRARHSHIAPILWVFFLFHS